MAVSALLGARIFDGERFHDGAALLLDAERIGGIVGAEAVPAQTPCTRLDGGLLAPGFVDAQVNGGGGIMLNDDPSPAAMAAVARAHRRFGTTALLPTLITDRPETTERALSAAASARQIPGVAGLHMEGPHLAPARKGTHLPELMHAMSDADCDRLVAAAGTVEALLVTLAPEQVTTDRIRRLAEAGIVVSLGHTDASFEAAHEAIEAGATGITHLFNAMSQLGHRAPGVVGAALDHGATWCGLIADGHHVDEAAMRIALAAKARPGRIFLVTDAMSTVGSDAETFVLNGRTIHRRGDKITLPDGTLAGSHLDMASAVRFTVERLGVALEEALRMASTYPAIFLGLTSRGTLHPGRRADLVHLADDLTVRGTWIGGQHEATVSDSR